MTSSIRAWFAQRKVLLVNKLGSATIVAGALVLAGVVIGDQALSIYNGVILLYVAALATSYGMRWTKKEVELPSTVSEVLGRIAADLIVWTLLYGVLTAALVAALQRGPLQWLAIVSCAICIVVIAIGLSRTRMSGESFYWWYAASGFFLFWGTVGAVAAHGQYRILAGAFLALGTVLLAALIVGAVRRHGGKWWQTTTGLTDDEIDK